MYEWHAEIWEGDGDDAEVIDRMTFDTYAAAQQFSPDAKVALVFDRFDKANGGYQRFWAYVTDGKMPTHFTDAYDERGPKVPAQFKQGA
jgi:hypothetical protein